MNHSIALRAKTLTLFTLEAVVASDVHQLSCSRCKKVGSFMKMPAAWLESQVFDVRRHDIFYFQIYIQYTEQNPKRRLFKHKIPSSVIPFVVVMNFGSAFLHL